MSTWAFYVQAREIKSILKYYIGLQFVFTFFFFFLLMHAPGKPYIIFTLMTMQSSFLNNSYVLSAALTFVTGAFQHFLLSV